MTKLKYIEKALLIGFVIAILFSFTSFTAFAAQCEQIPNEVFRLHVLANSDSEEDQALKLKVRAVSYTHLDVYKRQVQMRL